MLLKKDLSEEQIREIQSLRGKISAVEVKGRYGIGSTRLYRIWKTSPPTSTPQQSPPALPQTTSQPQPFRVPLPTTTPSTSPTLVDFYDRLKGLEDLAEETKDILLETVSMLGKEWKLGNPISRYTESSLDGAVGTTLDIHLSCGTTSLEGSTRNL